MKNLLLCGVVLVLLALPPILFPQTVLADDGVFLPCVLNPQQGLVYVTNGDEARFSPDGSMIAFYDGGSFYTVYADGSNRRMVADEVYPEEPIWSPDSTRILFWKEPPEEDYEDIFVSDVATGAETNLTDHYSDDDYPSWSPDGSAIAFHRYTFSGQDRSEIFLMNADGSNQRPNASPAVTGDRPAWSPDGAKIAFWKDDGGGMEIYVMNADGSGMVDLNTDGGILDPLDVWSPNSGKLVYVKRIVPGDSNSPADIYVVNADGTGKKDLTDTPNWHETDPAWSPDGKKIAYTKVDLQAWSPNPPIYLMNADGSGKVYVTAGLLYGWSPDGSKLLLVQYRPWGGPSISTMDVSALVNE